MVSHLRRRILCFFLTVLAALPITVAAADGPVLFVVPARQIAVRFAFDMAMLRSAFVISYQPVAGSRRTVLHVWDSKGKRWIEIKHNSLYAKGALFATVPNTVFLLGTEAEVPAVVRNVPWAREVVPIPEFTADIMINTVDGKLNLTPAEWKWLAPKYKLQLEDRNWERRRYGRYGPPGKARRVEDESVATGSGNAAVEMRDGSENVSIVLDPTPTIVEPAPLAPKALSGPAVSKPRMETRPAPAEDVPSPVNVAPDPALK